LPAIGFVSPKGGAGKTTAALVLALELADRGFTVAMIDADPNKPLMHWASLPGRPANITVHAAPTMHDVRDALREAQRRSPEWIILDTEGSERGAMTFRALRLDLVLTPLAASQIEALQALKAAEMVGRFGAGLLHRCVVTRLPAAIRPRSLKQVVDQLRARGVDILPTPLIEKEAFRQLFAVGGDLQGLAATKVAGITAARHNAAAYLDSVMDVLKVQARPAPAPASAGVRAG
jgi:chromosome partitioning protein